MSRNVNPYEPSGLGTKPEAPEEYIEMPRAPEALVLLFRFSWVYTFVIIFAYSFLLSEFEFPPEFEFFSGPVRNVLIMFGLLYLFYYTREPFILLYVLMLFVQSSGLFLLAINLLGYGFSETLYGAMGICTFIPWLVVLLRLRCNNKLVQKLWIMAALATFVYLILQIMGLLISSWLLAGFADEAALVVSTLMTAFSFIFIRPEQIARRRWKKQ